MNKDKQDATKWPANDEWLVSLDISSNTITQKSGFHSSIESNLHLF